MIQKINHIGIVVKDLEKSIFQYSNILKLPFVRRERIPSVNTDAAFFQCGEVLVELLCPYGPGVNQDFLEKNGGGIHHIAYEVDDIEQMYEEFSQSLGHKDSIQVGANQSKVFFINPEKIANTKIEFVEFPR